MCRLAHAADVFGTRLCYRASSEVARNMRTLVVPSHQTSIRAKLVWAAGLMAMVTACEGNDGSGKRSAGSECSSEVPCKSAGTECRAGWCVSTDAGTSADSGLDAGADAASVADGGHSDAGSAWPTDPPPMDTPRPLRADLCDFGTLTDDMVVLASGDIASVVVDQGYAYFGTKTLGGCSYKGCFYDYALKRVPRCGGAVEDVTNVTSSAVVGGGMVYWSDGTNLIRYHEADRTTEIVATGGGCIGNIAANETEVVVYDNCRHALLAGTHVDGALAVGVDGLSAPSSGPLLALGTSIAYFNDAAGIAWWSFASGARGRAFAASGPLGRLSVGDPGLLVGEPAVLSMTLTAIPWQGAAVPLDTVPVLENPPIDNGAAYWFTASAAKRVLLDGSWATDTVLERTPLSLDVYGGRLYWVESRSTTSPSYLLTAKPQSPPQGSAPPAVPPLWDKQYGGAANESFSATALDTGGNIYVLGTTSGTTDLGTGTLSVQGASAPLVAKLGPDGTTQWSQVVDAYPSAPQMPRCLSVNGAGVSAFTMDSGDAAPNVPEVRQLTTSGTTAWTRSGTSGTLWPACAVTDQGDVVVTVDADVRYPNISALYAIDLLDMDSTGGTKQETFLGALDAGESFATSQLVAVPGGGFALTGQLVGSVDLGDGLRDAQGGPATLIVRLAADGTLLWSHLLRGGQSSRVRVDASGRTVVAAQTTLFVDSGSGEQWVPRPLDPFTFVFTFAANGTISGSWMLDGAAIDLGLGGDGGVYLSGFGHLHVTTPVPPDVLLDAPWVVKFDSQGAFASTWPTPWLDYGGPWIAVGGGRLVVAGTMGRTNSTVGFQDTQGDVAVFSVP